MEKDCDKGLWQACVRKGNYKLIWGQVCGDCDRQTIYLMALELFF